MIKNEELMPEEYEEEWTITMTSRETFTLNEKQVALLREADKAGMRGMIHFDKFSISLAHIVSLYRTSRKLKIKNKLIQSENEQSALPPEEAKKKIAELKKKLIAHTKNTQSTIQ